MKQYKIIFVDIDGTLVSKGHEISAYTKDVMKRVKEKGIIVAINSGRSLDFAIRKSKEAGLSDYVIASNGAEVYNYKEKTIIFNQSIPAELISKLNDYCNETHSTLILNALEKRYCNNREYNYDNEPVEYYDNVEEVTKNHIVNQLIVISTNYDRMIVLPALFEEKFPELKIVHSSIALSEQRREKNKQYYHDLVLKNTSKGRGIVELLDYLKIDSKDAIAIGNGYDDISMMDVVGTKVAVENANDTLKEMATHITDTCDNDGVAKIIEKLCLQEK